MKKYLLIFSLMLISGCSVSQNLQANIFSDLWNKYVTEEDTSILTTQSKYQLTKDTEQEFAKLSQEIVDLRNFLINGGMVEVPGAEELVFQEGLMKIAGNNNFELVEILKETYDLIAGNNGDTESLEKETEKMKKNFKETCQRQRSSIWCDL